MRETKPATQMALQSSQGLGGEMELLGHETGKPSIGVIATLLGMLAVLLTALFALIPMADGDN